jgi:RNA-binding motif X-linked protein 2
MNLDMPRDKQTGKTRGFAFLQYEDQRSTVLAVDNLNGAKVLGRVLRVDHTHKPKPKKDEEGNLPDEPSMNAAPPLLGESLSLRRHVKHFVDRLFNGLLLQMVGVLMTSQVTMVLTLRIIWQPICGRRRERGRGRKKSQKKRNQRRGTKRKEIDQLIMMRRQI